MFRLMNDCTCTNVVTWGNFRTTNTSCRELLQTLWWLRSATVDFLDLTNRACGMGATPKTGQERPLARCNRKLQSLVCLYE